MPETDTRTRMDGEDVHVSHECRGERPEPDMSAVAEILAEYADDPGALIAVLQATQRRFGYLPKAALREIATARGIPFSNVYGVATFYSQFHLRPRGDRVVRICHGTACHVRGAPEVTHAVSEELGVKVGETTEDLAFTLESVACVGCCGLAPVILVDEETHGQLDVVEARRIATHLREESVRGAAHPSTDARTHAEGEAPVEGPVAETDTRPGGDDE